MVDPLIAVRAYSALPVPSPGVITGGAEQLTLFDDEPDNELADLIERPIPQKVITTTRQTH